MLPVWFLLACSGEEPPPPPTPAPVAPTLEVSPAPAPRRGVAEIETPPQVIRATEAQDVAGPAHLDVYFDPDITTFDTLGNQLESWGFSLLDGDGESWRVSTPPGVDWPARLLAVPGVARVREAVDLLALETGNFREGSERYGDVLHTWSWREGGPTEKVTGGPTPLPVLLPRALPVPLVRCLAPVRTAMTGGISSGVGWERALIANPPSWVAVFEHYGACDASGWMILRPEAALDGLTIGGQPAAGVDAAAIYPLAARYLAVPRPEDDPSALAAYDLLRGAPVDVLGGLIGTLAPGDFQGRLWQGLYEADPTAALGVVATTGSATIRAGAVAEDAALREKAVLDPQTPSSVLWAALGAWRPSATTPPDVMERLRNHASPKVRERAWEIEGEQKVASCKERANGLATLDAAEVSAVYRECPVHTVRVSAFNRLATLDRETAVAVVRVALEEPETTLLGVLAARQMAALERYDLLASVIARPTVARDVRRVAMEHLVKGQPVLAPELVEQHGAFLGYRAPPGSLDGTTENTP